MSNIAQGLQVFGGDIGRLVKPEGRLTLSVEKQPISARDELERDTVEYVPYTGLWVPAYNPTLAEWGCFEMYTGGISVYFGTATGEIYDLFAVKGGTTKTGTLSGLVASSWGSATACKGMAITGASNATPIVITASGHGLADNAEVYISGVQGNISANGHWQITYIDANTFSLNNSYGYAAYTSGGWLVARSAASAAAFVRESFRMLHGYTSDYVGDFSYFLGIVRAKTTGLALEDSQENRLLWNAWNQVLRPMKRTSAGSLGFVTGGGQAIIGTVDGANSVTMHAGGYATVSCGSSGMLGVWG